MKNVFFAQTPSDLKILKKHYLNDDIAVVAADLEVQNAIGKEFNTTLLQLSSFKGDYYATSFWKKESQAIELTHKVLNVLLQRMPQYTNYFLPLQSRIEVEFLESIETYVSFKSLEEKFHPKKYIRVSHNATEVYSLYNQFGSFVDRLFENYILEDKSEAIPDERHLFDTAKIKNTLNPYTLLRLPTLATALKRILKKPEQLQKSDIVFFSGGKNLVFYEKLIHRLQNDDKDVRLSIITGFQTLEDERVLDEKNIKFVSLQSINGSLDHKEIEDKAIEFIKKYESIAKEFKSIFAIMDLPLAKALINSLDRIVIRHAKNTIKQTYLAEKVIADTNPKLLITTHDPGPNAMPFVLAAKHEHIKTLVLMHGWQDTILGVNHTSDHIAVWGPYTKTWYEKKLKKAPTTVHALGYPLLDELFIKKKAFWQKKQRPLKFSSPIKVSILLTMYFPTAFWIPKFLDDIFRVVQTRNENVSISLRLHPGQHTKGIKERARLHGIEVEIDNQTPLVDYIENSDVVLSLDTTAILWAMILGKPLFYCAPNWGRGITPINTFGGAWIVNSPEGLFSKISDLKINKKIIAELNSKQKIFLKKIIGTMDKSATEKYIEFIDTLLKNR